MMLSHDKITHMSHMILRGLMERNLLTLNDEEGAVRRTMKRVIMAELKMGEDMEDAVRRKIFSLSRQVVEGSPEWEVLYKKYYAEEEVRRGLGR